MHSTVLGQLKARTAVKTLRREHISRLHPMRKYHVLTWLGFEVSDPRRCHKANKMVPCTVAVPRDVCVSFARHRQRVVQYRMKIGHAWTAYRGRPRILAQAKSKISLLKISNSAIVWS